MKRNDVVYEKAESWRVFGRINRIIDNETVEWIDCCRNVRTNKKHELEVENSYKGYWETKRVYHRDAEGGIIFSDGWENDESVLYKFVQQRFVRMPTLRTLKQMASYYAGRSIWKKG